MSQKRILRNRFAFDYLAPMVLQGMKGIRRWWQFMLHPGVGFRKFFADSERGSNLLVIFLSGIILLHLYVDLMNLADTFPMGKIMTVGLIMGPIIGLLFMVLAALFLMITGCLLDPGHISAKPETHYYPPLLFKGLILRWTKGGRDKRQIFDLPVLRQYRKLWTKIARFLMAIVGRISGGKVSYMQLFSGLSRSMQLLLVLGFIQWLDLISLEGLNYQSGFSGAPIYYFGLVFKVLLPLWLVFHWYNLLREGFQLNLPSAISGAIISLIACLGGLFLLLKLIFNLPVI